MRRFMRRTVACGLVMLLVMCLLGGCSCSTKSNVRLGTGNEGGTYYVYGEKLEDYASNITIKTTAGSEANLRLLDKGYIDAAIAQSDSIDISTINCSAVTGLYTEAVQIIVRKDSGINSVEGLRGKRVSIGEEESGVIRNAEQIFLAAGLTLDDVTVSHLSFSNAAKAMERGEIDAFFCTAGAPTKVVAELFDKGIVNIVGLEDALMKRLINLYPGYNPCTIPAGSYKGQTNDVVTVGLRAVLVVSPDMKDDTVTDLIKAVIDNSEELNKDIVTDGKIDGEAAVLSVGIPFHPAAAAYLETMGVHVAKWTGKVKKTVIGSQDD